MSLRPAVFVPLILAGLGLVFLGVAPWLLFNESSQRDLERGRSLASASAATLPAHAAGETVLLEGRLAAGNRAVFRDFVAYQRDRYLGEETSGVNKGKERWQPLETITPPLQVETGDGTVAIVNQGYELRGSPHRWWDKADRTNLTGREGERAHGFFAGDQVMVEGRIVEVPSANGTASTRALEAQVLSAGDRAAYLAYLRGGVLATRIIGGVFLGVGALLVFLGGWLLRRALRNKNKNRNLKEKEDEDEEETEPEDEGEDQHDDEDEDEDADENENKKRPTSR